MSRLSQRGATRWAVFLRLAAFIVLASGGVWVLSVRVQALSTYNVDNSCPTSGNGTTTTCGASGPFRTIKEAVDNPALAAGDTIKVKATGTPYSEGTITTHVAGTSAAPITITRYDGDTSKPVWTGTSGGRFQLNHPYYVIDNVDIDNANLATSWIIKVNAPNTIIRNCKVHNSISQGISIQETGDNTTIDSCEFYDIGADGNKHAITTGRSPDPTTYVLTGLRIVNNTLSNLGGDGIQLFEASGGCRLATVTGLIDGNIIRKGTRVGHENAIDIKTTSLASDPLIVSNNTITGYDGSSTSEGNRAVSVGHCVEYVKFRYNFFDAFGPGNEGLSCNPCIGLNIQADAGTNPAIEGIEVVGNIFKRMKIAVEIGAHDDFLKMNGGKFYHNTADSLRSGGQAFSITTTSATYTNNLLQNNLTYNSPSGGSSTPTGWTYSHKGWFSTSCGQRCGSNDVTGTDPLFVDATNDNYNLQAGSTAIDKGIDVGLAYNDAAPDLGAKESGGVVPPPPSPPAAPTGLTATAVSTTQINLTWSDASSNESGFRIERKTGAGGTYAEIATAGSNVTSYQNTGLTASTTYFYRLRAYNAGGNSPYSNEVSATTQSPPPPSSDQSYRYFEAESPNTSDTAEMEIISDAIASGDQAIRPKSTVTDSTSPQDEATYSFNLSEAGTYYLWVRMLGETVDTDALYARFDNSTWDRIFRVAGQPLNAYHWVRVETTNNSGNFAHSLAAGSHTVKLGYGEPLARADRLLVTSDQTFTPTGTGQEPPPPPSPADTTPPAAVNDLRAI